MALSYANLFGDLSAIIVASNGYTSVAGTTLANDLTTLLTQFGTRQSFSEGLTVSYAQWQAHVQSWRSGLSDYAQKRILDQVTVLAELGLSSANVNAVLAALDRQMRIDTKTVNKNTTSVGSVTYTSSPANAGNGKGYPTLTLDGYNAPSLKGPANLNYNGLTSELNLNETHTVTCIRDSYTGGVVEGSEQWFWKGGVPYGDWSYQAEGSGDLGTLTGANSVAIIANKDFESFSVANTPDSWTISAGTVGVQIFSDSTAGNFFRGTTALKLVGAGAGNHVTLAQAIAASRLNPKRTYSIGVAIKASATDLVGAVTTLHLTGTGIADTGIAIVGTSLPTSWTLFQYDVRLPAVIPSDLALTIDLNGVAATKTIWIDSIHFAPKTYFAGTGLSICAGQTPWQYGDSFTFATTNDYAGVYQTFFRRKWGFQLPSAASGNISPAG